MRNKVILLTGASGFLGSSIAKNLVAENVTLLLLVRNKSSLVRLEQIKDNVEIINIEEVSISEIFNNRKIDLVIHAAASYGKRGETIEEIVASNYSFPLSLLLNSIESGVKEFINIGTSLDPFVNEYSLTKHQFAEWLEFYKSKINIKNVVLEYFYGPGDDSWKFVTMLFEKFKSNAPFIDFTSGEQKRNFIFITDVVNGLMQIINSDCNNDDIDLYHLKSNETISIKELVYLCKKISKNSMTKLNFGVVNNRKSETKELTKEEKKFNGLQNWCQQTNLVDGLGITWRYINEKNN
jgi:CDP-paratose synthetase